MSTKVTIIDYSMGNLLSVVRAFERCGAEVALAQSPAQLVSAERIVLPGVGAFSQGIAELNALNLIEPLKQYARTGRPFMGICLGMQMMLDESEEFGSCKGLGLIPGRVIPVPKTKLNGQSHKVPHIGWNDLIPSNSVASWNNTILAKLAPGVSSYFVHSFMAMPESSEARLADCDYNGHAISAVIKSGSLYGCQFHPEKSGEVGLAIIKNFLSL